MKQSEKSRRLGLDKLAFLILFLLGLLLAKFMISFRSDFKLSEPVKLKGTGLEVSIPAGDNWKQISNGFKYEKNEFRFACLMQISRDSAITLQWRYFLLPAEKPAPQRLQDKALAVQGIVEFTESNRFGDLEFDYAKIDSNQITLFYGTTALPDGRILTLEVGHKGRGVELAEKIFKALLASAKYQKDNPLAKGAEFLKNFKNSYPASLPPDSYQNYYRIKDTRGSTIGFMANSVKCPENPNKNSLFSSAELLFLNTRLNSYAEMLLFHSDISLTKFDWSIKQSNFLTNREQPIFIQLDSDSFTVNKQSKAESFAFTDTMLPETFFDIAVAAFLKSSFDTVMLDFVLSDGRIAPAIISKSNMPPASVPLAKFAASVELFGTNTIYQKNYFDGEGRMLLAEVQSSFSYKIERVAKADILADFPQWLEKIQQMEQYKPQKAPGQKPPANDEQEL
ncbi:MAG: hypothetical protein KJ757_03200 [Planctomycetes bacterium]|nr:hypothetical protein [Planctomycetota bacterium]MBU1517752.1 hypothetical protein [Planctomycetota bacterium]MBU2457832.1 hypothetical protein [Planctomycetota bacterium]MBU2596557.1 hypothetical protein [Planctomycetota bacterium]